MIVLFVFIVPFMAFVGIPLLLSEKHKYLTMSLEDIEFLNGRENEVLVTARLYAFGVCSGTIKLYGDSNTPYSNFYKVYSVETGHEYTRGFEGDYFRRLFSTHIEAHNKKNLIQEKINKNYDYVLKNIESELNEQFKVLEKQQSKVNNIKVRIDFKDYYTNNTFEEPQKKVIDLQSKAS